ncbi:diguanylate cyclase [Rugamonas sp. CCM 8940]|uniref:GGDEF domain-containing protein n=1 Tax=Rugamonas sp. CCM 8940 TaxID=2765359 RepID=UPI0018F3BCBD|nr:GGDEF domain-containing protein [Rugamonas sp. CCM 8940]MBJ7310163.1 diguanylate cyclase [Rugamonas sp. CCM 8940]
MKLTRLFAVSIAVLALLSGAMLGHIVLTEWNNYRAAADGLRMLELVQKSMLATEKLSAERGPANGLMGDGLPHRALRVQRLADAREASDRALADLRTCIDAGPAPSAAALATLRRVQPALLAARRTVDQLAALEQAQRPPAELTAAVEQMFALVPIIMETVNEFSRSSEQRYPQFAVIQQNARFAVELREYAGRLGSQLTAALAGRQPLDDTAQRQIQFIEGRIEQLRQLIKLPTNSVAADPRLLVAVRAMEQRYFGDGLALVAEMVRASRAGLPYQMDTGQFAERYVPTMTPILRVRDVLLEASLEQARQAYDTAQRQLLLACATGALTLLVLTVLVLIVRRRVIRPLLWATRALVNLSNGDLASEVRGTGRRDEVGDLLRALVALRAGALDKQRLEQERQHLIEELRRSADTDYLTGILNRRAFTVAGQLRMRGAQEQDLSLAVILFDIDHFKSVNDCHGHDAGDQVLIRVAALVRHELRDGEILARYGGEEFVVMPAYCDLNAARVVAERLRRAIEAEPLPLVDGHILRITASFGVAAASGQRAALDSLFHAADLALYRAKHLGRNRVEG